MTPRFYVFLVLSILIFSNLSFAQTGSIVGEVKDADNAETLIGANVSVEGTSLGAVTDLDGKYRIDQLVPKTYSIKISYVGYDSKTISGY